MNEAMNERWAASIRRGDAALLGVLRLEPGVLCLEAGGLVWIRGDTRDKRLDLTLRAIRGIRRYRLGPDDQLVGESGGGLPPSRLPVGRLPEGEWMPAVVFFRIDRRPATLAAELPGKIALRLTRSKVFAAANVLLTTCRAWTRWATSAPQIRLDPLRFAVSSSGRVVIVGSVLPPIRGRHFVAHDDVAVPAGFTWTPQVDPGELRRLQQLQPGDLLILSGTRRLTAHVIHREHLVRASRSAARLTEAEAPGT